MTRKKPILWACCDCKCTDVQSTCWVGVNDNVVYDDAAVGSSDHFCPQCDVDGHPNDGHPHSFVVVKKSKPFRHPEEESIASK
jgi:hypothetical protein